MKGELWYENYTFNPALTSTQIVTLLALKLFNIASKNRASMPKQTMSNSYRIVLRSASWLPMSCCEGPPYTSTPVAHALWPAINAPEAAKK